MFLFWAFLVSVAAMNVREMLVHGVEHTSQVYWTGALCVLVLVLIPLQIRRYIDIVRGRKRKPM